MKRSTTISILLSCVLLLNCLPAFAFETDQYNLPPVELADIGDEISEYVEASLRTAVDKVNSDIEKSTACIEAITEKAKGCSTIEAERKNLAFLRSNDSLARELFTLIGDGNMFTTKFGNWMRAHKFRGQPDRYKTSYAESIFILNPTDYLTISPTVKLFGVEFGIDKLEHFFQQGYKYYKIEMDAAKDGKTQAVAEKKAINWGQRSERTYYGLLVSGVYSNADLAANYAGMKFYKTLTKPLQIGNRTIPATVELKQGSWTFDPAALRENLLKPYITEHLNEALNPSSFRITLVRSVRRAVKKYACPDWQDAYSNLNADILNDRTKALEIWHGQSYGHTKRSHTVRISDTCYGGNQE